VESTSYENLKIADIAKVTFSHHFIICACQLHVYLHEQTYMYMCADKDLLNETLIVTKHELVP